ncbi:MULTISPECIES: hypothetical protein [Pseudomonas]|jgi:hypothetical protein|uniref:hypothetical protein n=1 Tax=Pseudomonas TaxID=286 RepID=UPI000AC3AA4F|nr:MULTISPECIES: hypothetical protein [Pseudomonas]NBB58202.1 hypothetical protein [Pseudomonas sp. ODNR1LW]
MNNPADIPSACLARRAMFVRLLFSVLLSVCTIPAMAAQRCTLTLAPSLIDFGSTTRGELLGRSPAGGPLILGKRQTRLQVQCAAPQPMRLWLDGATVDMRHFPFGDGVLQVSILSARLDGVAMAWRREGEESPVDTGLLRPGERIMPWRNGAAALGTHWDLELELDARINPEATRVRDVKTLENKIRIELE